jgi:DNA-binding protein HU-beta
MNKEKLIDVLASGADISKSKADAVLTLLTDTITSTLKKGDKVTLHGVGIFSVKKRAARTGRNPATGQPLKIAAKTVPSFTASKTLKDAVNASKK